METESREAQLGQMETQLASWGAKLDELVAKVGETGAKAKRDYRERLAELRRKHRAAKERVEELKSTGSEKWEVFKAGIDSAWTELDAAFKNLRA